MGCLMVCYTTILFVLLLSGGRVLCFDPKECKEPFSQFNLKCNFTFSEVSQQYEADVGSSECSVTMLTTDTGGYYWNVDLIWQDKRQTTVPNLCPKVSKWKLCDKKKSCNQQHKEAGVTLSYSIRKRIFLDDDESHFTKPKGFCTNVPGFSSSGICHAVSGIGIVVLVLAAVFVVSKAIRVSRNRAKLSTIDEVMKQPYTNNRETAEFVQMNGSKSLSNPLTSENIKDKMSSQSFRQSTEEEYSTIVKISINLKETFRAGNKVKNASRNLDADILPYDSNRVRLRNIGMDEDTSDYINASWIRKLNVGAEIIATGVPRDAKPETIYIFWQMVLENKMDQIIMIRDAFFVEQNSISLFPKDIGEDASIVLQLSDGQPALTITLLSIKQTHMIVTQRILLISSSSNHLKVKHQHVTKELDYCNKESINMFLEVAELTWSEAETACRDGEVTTVSYGGLQGLGRMLSYDGPGIVMQCELGVKCSGTYLIFIHLRKELEEKREFNIPKTVTSLRKDRMNMVPEFQDYLFLYKMMLNYLENKNKNISRINLAVENISEVRRKSSMLLNRIKTIYEKAPEDGGGIELLEIKLSVENTKDSAKENGKWNRNADYVPYDYNRVVLSIGNINYINASHLRLENFLFESLIVSQGPDSETEGSVDQFWRMIIQTKVTAIIQLIYWPQDQRMAEYVSTETELTVSDTNISTSSVDEMYGGFSASQIFLENTAEERKVDHIKISVWPNQNFKKPREAIDFIDTILEIWEYIPKDGRVLVHCDDGVRRSGIFLTLSILLHRRSSNIMETIQELRLQRDKMVPETRDFKFLQKIVNNFDFK